MSAPRPGRGRRFLLLALALILFSGFMALGTWQVRRMVWKHALIARVEQRVHAAPVQAPGPAAWSGITAQSDEYRHVRLRGRFLDARATLVQALTELGGGFWLVTPLQRDDGSIVLVNRGFLAAQAVPLIGGVPRLRSVPDTAGSAAAPSALSTPSTPSSPAAAPQSPAVEVTGLLRITEPGGGFLRKNDPAGERWYSRDVEAITAHRGLTAIGPVAPYFIDADADAGPPAAAGATLQPVAGLTVISFPDNHLAYALTWYALGAMVAGVTFWLLRGRAGRQPVIRAADIDRMTSPDHHRPS